MARKRKRPDLRHCKVRPQKHPTAPWRVSYRVEASGKRETKRKSFADEDDAYKFAEDKEREIENHGLRFGDIPPEARRAIDHYRDKRETMENEGMKVPCIEDLVRDALKDIKTRFDEEAKKRITVADAVEEFLEYRETKKGNKNLPDIKSQLGRFAETFGTRFMDEITIKNIEKWLKNLRYKRAKGNKTPPLIAPQTRVHYRSKLNLLFKHGVPREWCSDNPVRHIAPDEVEGKKPKSYDPEDVAIIMQTALDHVPEILPGLALGMFAGVRVSEAKEIDLAKLPKRPGQFKVDGKTGERMAFLTEAGVAWLKAQPRRSGKAWLGKERNWDYAVERVFDIAQVKHINNGVRKSFISYRDAELQNEAVVSHECGNSPKVIKDHYRDVRSKKEAERFFSIRPSKEAGNVTDIEEGRKRA